METNEKNVEQTIEKNEQTNASETNQNGASEVKVEAGVSHKAKTSNPNTAIRGQKISESVTILAVSYTNPKNGERRVVVHTTKCRVMKTKEGLPVERFTFTMKQWNNFVLASGKPEIIYNKQIIGGKYNIISQFVEAGDPFLAGEGVYTTDHFARVSETIVMSANAVAKDTEQAEKAYYASMFSTAPIEQVVSIASQPTSNELGGEDIDA